MLIQDEKKKRFQRAKLKVKLRPFAIRVHKSTGLAIKMLEELLDSIDDKDIKTVFELLSELGIQQQGNYWEAKY